MTSQELAYAAGILDGEGSIIISHTKYQYAVLFVTVSNTHHGVIKWLHKNFGGSVYQNKQPKRKLCYKWTLCSNQAVRFLEVIYPFLMIKKERAKIAIKFQNKKSKQGTGPSNIKIKQNDLKVYYQMKRLNQVGDTNV